MVFAPAEAVGEQLSDLAPALAFLLASFSSSVLPVSNLTNLIAVEHLDLSVGDVVTHLALPSLVATTVGWLVYRTRHPISVHLDVSGTADRRVLTIGSVVVGFVLVGFVLGPSLDIAPWIVAAVADLFLVVVVRRVPWRDVPVGTGPGGRGDHAGARASGRPLRLSSVTD